jgi:thiol-disulfide isomerase/thioredoxin
MGKRVEIAILFVVWWVVLASACQAQQVLVTGQATGFSPGSLVRVQVYADPFSGLEKTLAVTRTDSSGNFRVAFPVKRTEYAMLAVNLKRTAFFLKPGASYHFDLKIDSTASGNTPFDKFTLQRQLFADDDSLNAYINIFDGWFDSLLMNHFRDIYVSHNRQVVSDFSSKVQYRFAKVKSPYLHQYIRYSIASLMPGLRAESLPEIVRHYFAGQPVLYHNIRYAAFFLDFFRSYFNSTVKKPVTIDRLLAVVHKRDIRKLDSLFALAPGMKKDAQLRQMAEMVQLANAYNNAVFDKADIEALFRQMAADSPFAGNRKVAKDYLVKLRVMQPGTKAPDFLLPDVTGKEYALKDFSGKFVLLDFVRAGCPVCLAHLKALDELNAKWGNAFTIVSLVNGKITPQFLQDARPDSHRWPFLLIGKDILLLERYQVVTYPAYVLIDPRGRILLAPAPMPDENLQQVIGNRINSYKKSRKN